MLTLIADIKDRSAIDIVVLTWLLPPETAKLPDGVSSWKQPNGADNIHGSHDAVVSSQDLTKANKTTNFFLAYYLNLWWWAAFMLAVSIRDQHLTQGNIIIFLWQP